MPKTKEQKKTIISSYDEKLDKAKSIVLVEYAGLKVKDNEELRNQCKKENSEYVTLKKSLAKIAFDKKEIKDFDLNNLDGSVAMVLGYEDEVTPAKLVDTFVKKHNVMKILAGIIDSKVLQAAQVKELAKLPSKQELLGKVVATINAPISGFVNVLAGNLRGLVQVLNAVKEKKQ